MIHHVSLCANDPSHVAKVLSELMGGHAYPFLGAVAGSWMAVSGDEVGTMIEVRPAGDTAPAAPFLLSVRTDLGIIERIARRVGWRCGIAGRGLPGKAPFYHVVEFWIENRVMVELVPEDMMDGYMELMQPPALDDLFSEKIAA